MHKHHQNQIGNAFEMLLTDSMGARDLAASYEDKKRVINGLKGDVLNWKDDAKLFWMLTCDLVALINGDRTSEQLDSLRFSRKIADHDKETGYYSCHTSQNNPAIPLRQPTFSQQGDLQEILRSPLPEKKNAEDIAFEAARYDIENTGFDDWSLSQINTQCDVITSH